ncbi:MAG: hypothetical protein R3C68_14680 [Myxococcota bacterium]
MSASGGNNANDADDKPGVFVEGEHATVMDYDSGGIPVYIGVVWVVFSVCLVIYMLSWTLPDLSAWLQP